MWRLAAVTVMVGLLLLIGVPMPGDAASGLYGYSKRSADRSYPCGEWVTLGSVRVPPTGVVTVLTQLPIEARSSHARVRFLRLPQRDGTGDLDVTMSGRGRWHVTHRHTVVGWPGRMAVQAKVYGCERWVSPYLIVKALT
jgi:hypothetical protein